MNGINWILGYVEIELLTIFVCILLLVHNRKKYVKVNENNIFEKLLVINMIMCFLDMLSWIYEADVMLISPFAHKVILSLYFFVQMVFATNMLRYVLSFFHMKFKKIYQYMLCVPVVLGCEVIIYNLFYPIAFSIEENGHYYRLPSFFLIVIAPVVFLTISIFVCLWQYFTCDAKKKKKYSRVLFFSVIPLVVSIMSAFWYGFIVWPVLAMDGLYLYLMSHSERENAMENRIFEEKTDTMMDQIQLNFVRETLGEIRKMCITDERLAQTALYLFQEFLCANAEAIREKRPVPFEKEYSMVKNYTDLKKILYGQKLVVNYIVETKNFYIPSLTLLPMVQNAITLGLEDESVGGVVDVVVRVVDDWVEIEVNDDGKGFCKELLKEDDKVLNGISNVELRLSAQMNGEMKMESKINKGTKVLIRVPYKEVNKL